MKKTFYKIIHSLVGPLKIVVNDKALLAILWDLDEENPDRVRLAQLEEDKNHPLILETEKQLKEYFLGNRKFFELPLEMPGTAFQQSVWNLLMKIPYGLTCSYKDIAAKMGNERSVRAVGTANGRNPISIIVPCHRVIRSDGQVAGFAGGAERRQILLELERKILSKI